MNILRKCLRTIFLTLLFCYGSLTANAQEQTLQQSVRGVITDAESGLPLPGVIILLLPEKNLHAVSDENGFYRIENVPAGRQSFEFDMNGYERKIFHEIPVTTGKELELNISLTENVHALGDVAVHAVKDHTRATNEFAQISARSFDVEETKRFAASVSDPARLAQNFAGVSNNGDLENDIVVHGNSSKGVLWRLEGIEIPNPNHFSDLGNAGGSISMLNASTLGTSDFYTGAFPPEIGDALSGAFDLTFRNGNKDKYEHSFQIGTLGTELATEGPFKRGGQSSYLIEYRYSTLTLLENFLNLGGILPDYQDGSFKLNFPTKKYGTFGVFGLGGYNKAIKNPPNDSTAWNDDNPNFSLDGKGKMGIAGIEHQYFVSKNAYIKTVIAASYNGDTKQMDTLSTLENYQHVLVDKASFANTAYHVSILYNNKLNIRNTIRTGFNAQQLDYRMQESYYDYGTKQWKNILQGNGNTQYYEGYFQWKAKPGEMTVVSGVHASYYALNKKYSIEPRTSITYANRTSRLSFAAGMHSKPDHISTYLFQNADSGQAITYPNLNLDLLRAVHIVVGYERMLPLNFRMRLELYYQYLYHIPVEKDAVSGFSILNIESIFGLYDTKQLLSTGTGKNYGIDISIERPLANDYYLLLAGSMFKSTYTDYTGQEYEGHYDRRYQVNIVGGKEFTLHKKGRAIIGVNGKILCSGGQRESPIDFTSSVSTGHTIYVAGQYFTNQDPYYFRIDGSLYYKLNNKKATHSIQLDVQNITDRKNFYYQYFDSRDERIKNVKQIGILPTISYRIDFHW